MGAAYDHSAVGVTLDKDNNSTMQMKSNNNNNNNNNKMIKLTSSDMSEWP